MTKGTTSGGPTRRQMLVAGAAVTAGVLLSPRAIVMAQADTEPTTDAAPSVLPASASVARKAVGEVEPAILRISREVWENAELS